MGAGELARAPRQVVFKQLFPFNEKSDDELCRCGRDKRAHSLVVVRLLSRLYLVKTLAKGNDDMGQTKRQFWQ